MKVQDAINLLNITGEVNAATVKQAFRKAAAKYHPDRNPAGLEMMKAVNEAREALEGYEGVAVQTEENYGDELNAVLNAAMLLAGLNLELCGNWLWVDGDTRTHKTALKEMKFRWAPKKKKWYFRPSGYSSKGSRGKFSMDDIRAAHGSTNPGFKRRAAIAA